MAPSLCLRIMAPPTSSSANINVSSICIPPRCILLLHSSYVTLITDHGDVLYTVVPAKLLCPCTCDGPCHCGAGRVGPYLGPNLHPPHIIHII